MNWSAYAYALSGPFLEDGPLTIVVVERAAVARGGQTSALPTALVKAIADQGFAWHRGNEFVRPPGLPEAAVADRLARLGVLRSDHLRAIVAMPIGWD